jgi:hypothetical protein
VCADLNGNGQCDPGEPNTTTDAAGQYSQTQWAFDISDNPGTHFYIEEWVSEQRDYAAYYNGPAPKTGPPANAPTQCNKTYPGSPQPGTNTQAGSGTGTSAAQWFATYFDYYTADYFDTVLHDPTQYRSLR